MINSHAYFICSGFFDDKGTPSTKSYVCDVSIRQLTQAPDMPIALKSPQALCVGDLIYVVGTIPKPAFYIDSKPVAVQADDVLTGAVFFLKTGAWSVLAPSTYGPSSFWPMSLYLNKDKLIVVGFNSSATVEFDLIANKWGDREDFVHSFDHFLVTKSGRCVLFHGYHNAIMDYDYDSDTITMMNTFDQISYVDSYVYFPQYDIILLKAQDAKNGYYLFDDKTNQVEAFGADDSKKTFGDHIGFITTASNMVFKSHDSFEDKFIEVNRDSFKDHAYIFGNWFQPLQINLCFTAGQ